MAWVTFFYPEDLLSGGVVWNYHSVGAEIAPGVVAREGTIRSAVPDDLLVVGASAKGRWEDLYV